MKRSIILYVFLNFPNVLTTNYQHWQHFLLFPEDRKCSASLRCKHSLAMTQPESLQIIPNAFLMKKCSGGFLSTPRPRCRCTQNTNLAVANICTIIRTALAVAIIVTVDGMQARECDRRQKCTHPHAKSNSTLSPLPPTSATQPSSSASTLMQAWSSGEEVPGPVFSAWCVVIAFRFCLPHHLNQITFTLFLHFQMAVEAFSLKHSQLCHKY